VKQGVKKPRPGTPAKKIRRKKPGAVDRYRAVIIAAVLIIAAGVFALAVIYIRSGEEHSSRQIQASVMDNTEPSAVTQASVRAVELPPVENKTTSAASLGVTAERPPVISRGKLAFVIDDAGYNLHELEAFLELSEPLTIAVLPGLAYSAEAARRIRAAGKEVFLHQPMEALGGQNPGPHAIRAGMDRDEIRSIIIRNLDEVGPVAGINNHEGSRVTMDEDVMDTVLALCREQGILFLDSRTTSDTAAPKAALRLGMNIAERDVFVDNEQDRESMIAYINTGLNRADQKGSAILIGHVWSAELAPLLAKMSPELREQGYSFSAVSALSDVTGL